MKEEMGRHSGELTFSENEKSRFSKAMKNTKEEYLFAFRKCIAKFGERKCLLSDELSVLECERNRLTTTLVSAGKRRSCMEIILNYY